jgi:hypothetical protein
LALSGVPVIAGPGRAYGEITDSDLSFSIVKASSDTILKLRKKMDERAGGKLPVVVDSPTVGLVVPRVTADGALRSVAFVNARIDSQKSVRLRLRGVPPEVDCATWWEMRGRRVMLPLERRGDEAEVVIPAISAWNCAWLGIGKM